MIHFQLLLCELALRSVALPQSWASGGVLFAGPAAGGLGLGLWGEGGRGREASIVPTAADVVTAGVEAGAPLLRPGSGTNISSYKKRKKEK